MTQPYGEAGEMFQYSAYLVLSNRIVAVVCAIGILLYNKESLAPTAPLYKYFGISFSNTFATYCQYEALKYVSFPTQTLGKCGKTIPVLILGTLIGGKTYRLQDYVVCVLITLGCTIFLLTGEISVHAHETSDSFYGLLLMGGYVFADGFTSVFQEKLFRGYKMSTYNQMLYVNATSAVISALILVFANQLMPAIEFSLKYPGFFANSLFLSLAAMLGQVVIYYSIKNFGALFFATVMTTRQVFSILLSTLIYFHPLSIGQWFGTLTVFGALYYEGAIKQRRKH